MKKDIEEIIKVLDEKTLSGTSRIKVEVDEKLSKGTVKEQYHHGRCDVGSPWAKGTVGNFEGDSCQ